MFKRIVASLFAMLSLPAMHATYYSQVGQDRYLNEQVFKNKKNGVFVDIGAFDGVTISNTYFFEKELGWTGICFEPQEEAFAALCKKRSCLCINACVAPQEGMVNFLQVIGAANQLSGMAATYDPRHLTRLHQECKQHGGSFTCIERPACNLMKALQERGIKHIDYLSIDSQGSELAILQSIDFDAVSIECITVENNYKNPAIEQLLTSKGFVLMTRLEQDEVYRAIKKQPKKIVALLPVHNEEWIIRQSLRSLACYVDAIVCLDDGSTDNSVKIIESMAKECKVERIIRKGVWFWNESIDRNQLLQVGREIGGTHFICLDSDEMFTANCLENNFLRNRILELQPGDALNMTWIQLWRSLDHYRYDNSVWSNVNSGFIFCDDGVCKHLPNGKEFTHISRIPNTLRGKIHSIPGYTHGVMHFQFVNWRNLLVKQAWYRCLEHIRLPQKTAQEINYRYAPSKNEDGLGLMPVPAEWYKGYAFFDRSLYEKEKSTEQWRERQVVGWFQEYGKEYFADLDVWDVDWGAGLVS